MRFATWESGGTIAAGVVSADGLHALPGGTTVLDLVRSGLPAALEAGTAALSAPSVPVSSVRLLPPLAAPTVRDFVAFEEHDPQPRGPRPRPGAGAPRASAAAQPQEAAVIGRAGSDRVRR